MSSTSVTLPAYAKVNLYLEVVGRRPDGYHELLTLFERIDLADEVTVTAAPGEEIALQCDAPEVPQDRTNLVVQAAQAYRTVACWSQGLTITLKKKIPAAAGLGGGSSDAATTLLALQKLNPSPLSAQDLHVCARLLGADIPFFLKETPWAIGRGRGDELEPVQFPIRLWHLCVTPNVKIATRAVYQALVSTPDEGNLTSKKPGATLLFSALKEQDIGKVRTTLFNGLEPTVEALYPVIRDVKAAIEKHGGLERPCVSGSGSTVFAVCSSAQEAQKACEALKRVAPDWRIRVAQTRV